MTTMTIQIENWKHISTREVLKVICKALLEMYRNLHENDFDGAKPLDSCHYNDYNKSGVELQIKWK